MSGPFTCLRCTVKGLICSAASSGLFPCQGCVENACSGLCWQFPAAIPPEQSSFRTVRTSQTQTTIKESSISRETIRSSSSRAVHMSLGTQPTGVSQSVTKPVTRCRVSINPKSTCLEFSSVSVMVNNFLEQLISDVFSPMQVLDALLLEFRHVRCHMKLMACFMNVKSLDQWYLKLLAVLSDIALIDARMKKLDESKLVQSLSEAHNEFVIQFTFAPMLDSKGLFDLEVSQENAAKILSMFESFTLSEHALKMIILINFYGKEFGKILVSNLFAFLGFSAPDISSSLSSKDAWTM
jgi:hypothetical protein